jgi:hypothetical protein
MTLDSRIDELFGLPLADFTASRNALAKTLSGEDAKRVRALAKPKLVPWTVNQLFWKARGAFDRLIKSGLALRAAQLATLEGRAADVRSALDAHRRALSDATGKAVELAAAAGFNPDNGEVARMLEALSLAAEAADPPGRWTEPVLPAGFEALAGVQPAAPPKHVGGAKTRPSASSEKAGAKEAARKRETERRELERAEAERRRLDVAVRRAEEAVQEAKASEKRAREAFDRAIEDRREAEAALIAARQAAKSRA